MRKQINRQLELFPNHSPQSHVDLRDGHRASVEIFSAAMAAAGGAVVVAETLPVDCADVNKMRKLHRDGYPVRAPQMGILLAIGRRDPQAREALTLKLSSFFGSARDVMPGEALGRYPRQQVLEAVAAAVLRHPDLLRLLMPTITAQLGAPDAEDVTAALAPVQTPAAAVRR